MRGALRVMLTLLLTTPCGSAPAAETTRSESEAVRGDLVIVVGAGGESRYESEFRAWGARFATAGAAGRLRVQLLGEPSDVPAELGEFEAAVKRCDRVATVPLWIVCIGHGTADARGARFNLPGPDLTAEQLRDWLAEFQRPLVVVNGFSASSPFVTALAGKDRVILSATRSASEVNLSRFGDFLSSSISASGADYDKDGQTSLLEAFLHASRLTEEYYATHGLLQTEHAVLDDNGDGRPVSLEGFDGLLPIRRQDPAGLLPDGLRAHQWHLVSSGEDTQLTPEQLARRNELEREIALLRTRKSQLSEADFDAALLPLCLELARLLEAPSDSSNVDIEDR